MITMKTSLIISVAVSASSPWMITMKTSPLPLEASSLFPIKIPKLRPSPSSVRLVCRGASPPSDFKFVLHQALDSSEIDTTHARDAREGFLAEVKKLTVIERETSISINRRVDLGRASLFIAAEDDSLVSHSSVPLPVDFFIDRLYDLSMGFCSDSSVSLSSSPDKFLDSLETYLCEKKGFRLYNGANQLDTRALYLHSVLTHRLGSAAMLSLIYSEILKLLRLWSLLEFDCEIFFPHDRLGLPKGYHNQKSIVSDQPHIMTLTTQALLEEILRNLKETFWSFQHDYSKSSFLRAADAANCIDRSSTAEERFFEWFGCCCAGGGRGGGKVEKQKRDDARQFMKFLHPDLGVELPERSYGADCRIYMPDNPTNRFKNVYDTLFDEFVVAHIFGWWGKAILIRNQPLLWVLSIGFELMEFTFRHMLPNFNECWWDSIVLDILICNWFGIWAGMNTVRYFDGKTYEWVGISRQPNIMGKVKRTLGQFTPAQWDKDEWHPLLGPWRFIQVLSLCIIFLTVELNTFFLKFSLWVPPRNPVIVYRLILWWLIAIPTIREYNSYLQDRKPVKKVGAFCWLSVAICIVELLICIKFGHGLYPNPMPSWLVMFWASIGAGLLIFLFVWTWQLHQSLRRKRQ